MYVFPCSNRNKYTEREKKNERINFLLIKLIIFGQFPIRIKIYQKLHIMMF